MRFIFTADWHLKLKFKDVPFVWLRDRFIEFLHWLEQQRLNTGATALVIGGDIFDHQPTLYEIALFSTLFSICNFDEYVIYPGNHEMSSKTHSFYGELNKVFSGEKITYFYERIGDWHGWQVVPYPLVKSLTKSKTGNLVLSHVRCASDRGLYDSEIDFSIFENSSRVLLGDIHTHRIINNNIWYPGAPFDTAFAYLPLEERFVLLVDEDLNVLPIKREDKFMRLIKLEVDQTKYDSIKAKIKESKNMYDIVVVVDSVTDLAKIEDTTVKKKLKLDMNNTLTSKDILEDISAFLKDVIKIDPAFTLQVMTKFIELGKGIGWHD